MFNNNFKVAGRRPLKDRQFTLVNSPVLSAGLVCTLLIYLWVGDELSFDKFNESESRLFQFMEQRRSADRQAQLSGESPGSFRESPAAQTTEVEYAVAAAPDWWQKFTLCTGDKNAKATGQYVGKDYLNIFHLN